MDDESEQAKSYRLENEPLLPKEVFADDVKWLMVPSKIILEFLGVWPEKQNRTTNFISLVVIVSYVYLLISMVTFVIDQDTDLAEAADCITGIVVAAESLGRRILSMILAKPMANILHTIYYDFWRSDIAGTGSLDTNSVLLVVSALGYFLSAYIYIFANIVLLFYQSKLPFSSKYTFDHTQSPIFEIMYVWQSLLVVEFDVFLSGFDFFLVGIIWNCVGQFKLLRTFLVKSFQKAVDMAETDPTAATKEAYRLVLVIFRRHNNLVRMCKQIDTMLALFTLMMYIGNIATLCLSSFLLTVVRRESARPLIYFCGHISQILFYCFVGNELSLESVALSDAVYQCGWHLLPYDRNLRKSLILIMARAQRPLTMTIGGFGILSLTSFMKLLQFCFSVYILLSKMAQK